MKGAHRTACVALDSIESERQIGFIDTKVMVDARVHEYITFPGCGMSKVPLKSIEPNEKRLIWNPFNMDFLPGMWCEMISELLKRNQLEVEDIDYFIFSQLSDVFNMKTLELLGIPEEKYYFVGKEYGYTGNTCPILCLNRLWDKYCRTGNRIVICTVGAGLSNIVQLYTF